MRTLALLTGLLFVFAASTAVALAEEVDPVAPLLGDPTLGPATDVFCNPLDTDFECTFQFLNCVISQIIFQQVCVA